MKRYSLLIKNIVKYQLIPVSMAITKKEEITKNDEDEKKRQAPCTFGEIVIGATTTGNSLEVPQKIKNKITR